MKKNIKKRRTIRRLIIATAFALLMIPASVSADTVRVPKAPEAPNPNLLEGMTGYGQVDKVDSNNTEYTELYATFRGTSGPNAGETLYAYNLDDESIYGSSKSRTVKVWIYRDKINPFNIADQSPRRWMLVSAKDPKRLRRLRKQALPMRHPWPLTLRRRLATRWKMSIVSAAHLPATTKRQLPYTGTKTTTPDMRTEWKSTTT